MLLMIMVVWSRKYLDEYTEDNHLIRSGMVDGRTYPVKLGVDYRPLCNIYGVEKINTS